MNKRKIPPGNRTQNLLIRSQTPCRWANRTIMFLTITLMVYFGFIINSYARFHAHVLNTELKVPQVTAKFERSRACKNQCCSFTRRNATKVAKQKKTKHKI